MFFRRRAQGGFTPPTPLTPRYWVGGAGTWDQSTTTHWSASSGGAGGASVPTALNDVIFDANSGSGTVTINASAPCNSLTSTASSIALTQNASVVLTVGSGSAAGPGNKALDLSGLTNYTVGGGSSSVITFVSTVPTQQTINYNGHTVAGQTFNGAGGSWQLTGALTATSGIVTLTAGSLDTNGQTVTCLAFTLTNSNTRSLTLGTSTINCTGTSSGQWDATIPTGLTFSGASSTINMSGNVTSTQLFRGGGLTYGTVNITGTGTVIVTGSNTFGTFHRANAVACGLEFINGTTQTVTTAAGWSVSGASGALITITTDSAGNAWTLSCASGTVSSDYLSLKDSAATGGATFHAGANSTNVSGNSGWLFP